MMSCLEIDPVKDVPEWSDLTDNRDLKAIPSWDPIDRAVNDDLISESYLLDQKFLKFRSLTLRALATAVYMSENIHPSRVAASNAAGKGEACEPNVPGDVNNVIQNISDSERAFVLSSVLGKIIDGLVNHQKDIEQDHMDFSIFNKSVLGPDSPRLHLYIKYLHNEFVVTLLQMTMYAYKMVSTKETVEQDAAKELCTQLFEDAITKFQKMVTDLTELVNNDSGQLFQRSEKLESIVNVTESSSFAAILCGVCQVFLKSGNKFVVSNSSQGNPGNVSNNSTDSGKASARKGNKKKSGKISLGTGIEIRRDMVDVYLVFNAMLKDFDSCLSSLLRLVEDFERLVALDQLSVLQTKFSALDIVNDGCSQMQDFQNHEDKNSINSESNILGDVKADSSLDGSEKVKEKTDNSLDAVQFDILKQMESSYGISFLQIKTVVQNKQNYFSFLKCDTGTHDVQMNK